LSIIAAVGYESYFLIVWLLKGCRAQGIEWITRVGGGFSCLLSVPVLEPCLRSTFGLVMHEEYILQIWEQFAGMSAGRPHVLRRVLVKQKGQLLKRFASSLRVRAGKSGTCARSKPVR
jgi:DNA polymerase III alpha subunit